MEKTRYQGRSRLIFGLMSLFQTRPDVDMLSKPMQRVNKTCAIWWGFDDLWSCLGELLTCVTMVHGWTANGYTQDGGFHESSIWIGVSMLVGGLVAMFPIVSHSWVANQSSQLTNSSPTSMKSTLRGSWCWTPMAPTQASQLPDSKVVDRNRAGSWDAGKRGARSQPLDLFFGDGWEMGHLNG